MAHKLAISVIFLAVFTSRGWASDTPTLADIRSIVSDLEEARGNGPESLTLDTALKEIGERYPELRENYVLMRESQSRQEASNRYPRVIASTADARFAMAFNGDPEAAGYHELEMYEFTGDEPGEFSGLPASLESMDPESFKFQRIVFAPEANGPQVKPVNERLCRGCHGGHRDAATKTLGIRPNWESYNLWEGTYYETDRAGNGERFALGYGTDKHSAFAEFYDHEAGKGRYAFLKNLDDRFLVPREYDRVPPSEFTQRLGYLNYRRLAHKILRSPDYETFKYAIIGSLYDCGNFQTMIPPAVKDGFARSFGDYLQSTANTFVKNENFFPLEDDIGSATKLRFLFEGRGISMHKWSMNFRRSPYSFVTPGGSPGGFISALLVKADPSLKPFRLYELTYGGNYGVTSSFSNPWRGSSRKYTAPTCRKLAQKSCDVFSSAGYECEDRRIWHGPKSLAGPVTGVDHFDAIFNQSTRCTGLLHVEGESTRPSAWGCLVARDDAYEYHPLPPTRFRSLSRREGWPLKIVDEGLSKRLFQSFHQVATRGSSLSPMLEQQYFHNRSLLTGSEIEPPQEPVSEFERMIVFGGARHADVPAPMASVTYGARYDEYNEDDPTPAGVSCWGDFLWNRDAERYESDAERSPTCVLRPEQD